MHRLRGRILQPERSFPPPCERIPGAVDSRAKYEGFQSRMRNSSPHVLFLNAQDGLGADVAVHLTLARTLDRRKLRVSAATSLLEKPGASARRTFQSIPDLTLLTLNLGRPIGQHHGVARAVAVLENLRGITNLVGLARWCRHNHVDVIHVTERPRQALFGLTVARMAGCACVIHAHTVHYRRDATRLANWRLRQADAVVGVSQFVAHSFKQLANLSESRVFTVHNAVDSAIFRPDISMLARLKMRQRLGIPAEAPLIGCVARLMHWKGQGTLLESFALVRKTVPDARLVLAGLAADAAPDGQGDYGDYLIRRIEALGLQGAVTLPGFLPQHEMPEFYGALDVLAHPSIEEPFGLAVVEAMASARPVIAIRGGGIPEIIRHGLDGLLLPAAQPAPMAHAIVDVLGNPTLARRLAESGRERVLAQFTPEIQANATLQVYQQVVARRTSARG
jgi:glycosyltransferase involved in cell wall biosynthesis